MSNQFRSFAKHEELRCLVAETPTRKVPALDITAIRPAISAHMLTARLQGFWADEAKREMHPNETPDAFFLRLLLFYQHANREVGDDE